MKPLTRRRLLASAGCLSAAPLAASRMPQRPQLGFYQWLGVSPKGAAVDLLSQARQKTVTLGSRLLRLYLGGRYDYRHPVMSPRRFSDAAQPPRSLTEILRLPPYRSVLDDPNLSTVVLTAYPVVNYGMGPDDINLSRPWGGRERDAERQQLAEVCEWLYSNYGATQKTIVIANSEADEKLREVADYTGDLRLAVDNLAGWTRDRFDVISAARRANPHAKLRLLHAFEISMVNLRVIPQGNGYRKGLPTAAGNGTNALESVLPEAAFDLVSYSSYEAANSPFQTGKVDTDPAAAGKRILRDIDKIRAAALNNVSPFGRAIFGSDYVMIGEIGFARDRFEHLSSGGVLPRLDACVDAAAQRQCPYVAVWQVFDAPRNGRAAWGFGAFDRYGDTPTLRSSKNGSGSLAEWMAHYSAATAENRSVK